MQDGKLAGCGASVRPRFCNVGLVCPFLRRGSLALAVAATMGVFSATSLGQSFSLDDNPSAPIAALPGVIPGLGAEDEFGVTFPGGNPGLAPSPSVPIGFSGDGTLFSGTIGGLQLLPDGAFIDAFSTNHPAPTTEKINIDFSVDRLTFGIGAVGVESAAGQAPGDIYRSTARFTSPAAFVGTLVGGPFAGPLPTAGSAPVGSNTLLIDDSTFGLTVTGVPGVTTPAGIPVPPPIVAAGTHDNVDGFDHRAQVADPFAPGAGFGVYPVASYFAIAPDEAAVVAGTTAADIFALSAGAPGTIPTPYAPFPSLGLIPEDSVDALVMFDSNTLPEFDPLDGSLATAIEPGIDYALFSLAPGSATLAFTGLSADDVLFTDFSGAFALYALSTDIGLFPGPGGGPAFRGDNVDALEIHVPEPATACLGFLALALVALGRRSLHR